jgi:AcrR family transcriptional regulator
MTMETRVDGRKMRRESKTEIALELLTRENGATVEELETAVGCSRRTIYHLLDTLNASGHRVLRQGSKADARYFIV